MFWYAKRKNKQQQEDKKQRACELFTYPTSCCQFSDMEKAEPETVPLGDVLQNLAMHSHEELKGLLEAMSQQTPLIRSEKLNELLQKSKRRFTQMYAILNWLQADHVRSYLKSTRALQNDVKQETVRLNTKLDTLFYMNAGEQTQYITPLSAKRIRPIESVTAAEIIAAGTYPFLPTSMFELCSSPLRTDAVKSLENTVVLDQTVKEEIAKHLELTIRTKLLNSTSIPESFDIVSFESKSGMLLLTCPDMFEVKLSLSELDVDAKWEVISFHLLVKPHDDENIDIEFAFEEIENSVMPILKAIEASDVSNDKCHVQSLPVHSPTQSLFLSTLYTLCRHSSLSVILRFIYMQALATIRTNYMGCAETSFHETNTFQICTLRLWCSSQAKRLGKINKNIRRGFKRKSVAVDQKKDRDVKEYEYEVLIYLSRCPGEGLRAIIKSHEPSNENIIANPSSIELDLLDASLCAERMNMNQCCDMSSRLATCFLDVSRSLQGGINSTRLINQIIRRCAFHRLEFLNTVIQASRVGLMAMKQVRPLNQ